MSECTSADQALARAPNSPLYCLTRGDAIGLTVKAQAGFLSAVSVFVVLALITRNFLRRKAGQKLLQQPMDVYMLSLFIADFIQAMGAVVNVKWVNEGKVFIGPYCTAQGVIQQLGETVVAITTLVIAIHTFWVIWWGTGKYQTVAVATYVAATVWFFVIMFVSISAGIHQNRASLYNAPTPYWCWISSKYPAHRIAGEYFWLWLALLDSMVFYTLLFLWSQGIIARDEGSWWKCTFHWKRRKIEILKGHKRIAYNMIAYPLAYSFLIIPSSVVRWIGFHQQSTGASTLSSAVRLSIAVLFSLSGAVNVLLFFIFRSNLLLFSAQAEQYVLPLEQESQTPSAPQLEGTGIGHVPRMPANGFGPQPSWRDESIYPPSAGHSAPLAYAAAHTEETGDSYKEFDPYALIYMSQVATRKDAGSEAS